MSHFYLTLPSNSSSQYFPNNTLTHFITRLQSSVSLVGDWEVGLAEIMYPRSWYNIGKGEGFTVYCSNCSVITPEFVGRNQPAEYTKHVNVHAGYFDTMESLVNEINTMISKTFTSPVDDWNDSSIKRRVGEQAWPSLRYNPLNKKVYVTVHKNMTINFTENLAYILGLTKRQNPVENDTQRDSQTIRGNKISDIDSGVNAIYIYCDLLECVPVGDTQAPLLRFLDVQGQHGGNIHRYFDRPRYIPLQKKHFDSVEIDIRDDIGQHIPFETGKLIVTLHFRRAKNAYFL